MSEGRIKSLGIRAFEKKSKVANYLKDDNSLGKQHPTLVMLGSFIQTVCWPWSCYVRTYYVKQVESTFRDLSRVESSLNNQPSASLHGCYVKTNIKHQSAHEKEIFFCSFTNIRNDWQFCITHTKRDKPMLWRQLLPRKDDGSRLKSAAHTKTISALQKNIGQLAQDKNIDIGGRKFFNLSSSYHLPTWRNQSKQGGIWRMKSIDETADLQWM